MTLFTSAGKKEVNPANTSDSKTSYINESAEMETAYYLKCSFVYLIIAVIIGIAGAVYEHFSFGVYSNFMIYAFAVPLLGGTLPYLISSIRSFREGKEKPIGSSAGSHIRRIAFSMLNCWTYHAAIATLTAGSIMQGILAICGRPNGLVIVYPITAAALLAAAAASAHTHKKKPGIESGTKTLLQPLSKTLINSGSDDLSGEDNGRCKTDKYAGCNTAE